jgi:hypothetical protein
LQCTDDELFGSIDEGMDNLVACVEAASTAGKIDTEAIRRRLEPKILAADEDLRDKYVRCGVTGASTFSRALECGLHFYLNYRQYVIMRMESTLHIDLKPRLSSLKTLVNL